MPLPVSLRGPATRVLLGSIRPAPCRLPSLSSAPLRPCARFQSQGAKGPVDFGLPLPGSSAKGSDAFEQLKQSVMKSRQQLATALENQGKAVAEEHDPRQLGLVDRFERDGYAIFPQLVGPNSMGFFQIICDKFASNQFNSQRLTFDLCSQEPRRDPSVENTTQILWPMEVFPMLEHSIFHRHALNVAQHLLGPDMAVDFDMLVTKPPRSNVPTPWHQDAAYWIDMPDKRALACWIAVDDATTKNGCLWYEPGAHRKPLRPHERYGVGPKSGGIRCAGSLDDAVAVELKAGDAVFHHARTPHCAGGNSTDEPRRAYVIYMRPQKMIAFLRENGFGPGRTQCTHTTAEPPAQPKQ